MKKRVDLRAILTAHPEYRYLLFIPAYLLSFFLMEHLVPADADYWVSWCPLDDYIPFVEQFVLPYCAWYPLLLVMGLGLMRRDVPELRRYMRFLILGFGFSVIFCLIFPNGQNLRPLPFPRDNFFTRLLGLVYAADTNTNVLPSMHVIGSVAAIAAVHHSRPLWRWRPWVDTVAVLICLSTVLVKQHSVLDVFAGLAVCLPLMLLYRKRR